jgi:integrase/recombinase XerC
MNITTKEAVEEFVLACRADGLAKASISWYQSILSHWAHSAPPMLGENTAHSVRQHIATINLSASTINAHTRALHRFWAWAADEYSAPNVMTKIRYPRPPKNIVPKYAAPNDIRAMFDSCGDDLAGKRARAIMAFLADTGCRAAGVCGLKVNDVDLAGRRAVVIEKGLKARRVIFTQFTSEIIQQWLAARPVDVAHVFVSLKTGAPLTPNGLLQMFNRIKDDAGIQGKVNPHAWRHGFARAYLDGGGDLSKLATLMGHSTVEVTALHYAVFALDELDHNHEQRSSVRFLREKP